MLEFQRYSSFKLVLPLSLENWLKVVGFTKKRISRDYKVHLMCNQWHWKEDTTWY